QARRRRMRAERGARPAPAGRRVHLRLGIRATSGRELPAAAEALRVDELRRLRMPRAELRVPLPGRGPLVPGPRRARPARERLHAGDGAAGPRQLSRYGRYSRPLNRSSLSKACVASIRRTVPERERMTI